MRQKLWSIRESGDQLLMSTKQDKVMKGPTTSTKSNTQVYLHRLFPFHLLCNLLETVLAVQLRLYFVPECLSYEHILASADARNLFLYPDRTDHPTQARKCLFLLCCLYLRHKSINNINDAPEWPQPFPSCLWASILKIIHMYRIYPCISRTFLPKNRSQK